MRGKSSSSKTKTCGLENENLDKIKEPHLSGAYIRSLVKQLTSSRTKDSSNSKDVEVLEAEGSISTNQDGSFSDKKMEKSNQPPQQHKKQVRRRLHTSRPYQERLLNMAEARREIVTALKFHRASMKQASEKQQEQQIEAHQFEPSSDQVSLEQEAKLKSRRNPRVYASNSSTCNNFPPNYMENFSYSPGFCSPYPWHVSPIPPPPPPPLFHENNLNFALPSQTLGLNLNLQDFNYFETTPFNNPSSIYSSSSPSTSSSPLSATTADEIPPPPQAAEYEDSGLHYAMDDKEMAEIRSIGEQYQMEWNDTLNLVNSAWWFKFLKSMEMENGNKGEGFVNSPFDEAVEFPAWLNANESCLQHVADFSSDDYFQDPDLPCMDIEEIEGMDGDWLA